MERDRESLQELLFVACECCGGGQCHCTEAGLEEGWHWFGRRSATVCSATESGDAALQPEALTRSKRQELHKEQVQITMMQYRYGMTFMIIPSYTLISYLYSICRTLCRSAIEQRQYSQPLLAHRKNRRRRVRPTLAISPAMIGPCMLTQHVADPQTRG